MQPPTGQSLSSILFERHFDFDGRRKEYVETPAPQVLHIRQFSKSNLKRRLESFAVSGTFIWYSGDTQRAGRGSVMVYDMRSSQPTRWFVAFVRKAAWLPGLTKGVSQQYVVSLLGTE